MACVKKHGLQVSEVSALFFWLYVGPLLRLHVVLRQGELLPVPWIKNECCAFPVQQCYNKLNLGFRIWGVESRA